MDSATKLREVQVQRQENMEGQARAKSWGLRGGFAEEVWHPSWALKNKEVVERQGQWGRHLAEGTAREQRQRGVKLRGESEISAIKLQARQGRGGDSCSIKSCGHGGPGGRQVKALGKAHWGLVPLPCSLQSGYWYCPLPGSLAQTTLYHSQKIPRGLRGHPCVSQPPLLGRWEAPPPPRNGVIWASQEQLHCLGDLNSLWPKRAFPQKILQRGHGGRSLQG